MASEWMQPHRPRSVKEAIDEVHRELCVRQRCFPRWIQDGRVSETDAQDRVDRLSSALMMLREFEKQSIEARVTSSGDMTEAASA